MEFLRNWTEDRKRCYYFTIFVTIYFLNANRNIEKIEVKLEILYNYAEKCKNIVEIILISLFFYNFQINKEDAIVYPCFNRK